MSVVRRARVKVGDRVRSLASGQVFLVVDKFQNPADFWRVVLLVENVENGDVDVFRTDEVEKV